MIRPRPRLGPRVMERIEGAKIPFWIYPFSSLKKQWSNFKMSFPQSSTHWLTLHALVDFILVHYNWKASFE